MSPEETASSVEMALGMLGVVGPSNHALDGGPDPPMVRGNFRPLQWQLMESRHQGFTYSLLIQHMLHTIQNENYEVKG